MLQGELYNRLTIIFRKVFSDERLILKAELTARDVAGWDSFRQIDIILTVEEDFGVKFHPRELDALQSIGDLARAIHKKIGRHDQTS
jgi:acyl carrier protein